MFGFVRKSMSSPMARRLISHYGSMPWLRPALHAN